MDLNFDIETIRKDAEKGVAAAQYNLGVWHARGEDEGAEPMRANHYYELAAQQDFPPAQTALGYLMLRNQQSDDDNARAAQWFERAAQGGMAEAQYRLGEMHAVGIGVTQNSKKAVKRFSQAAAQNHGQALCQYAYCLDHGLGCDRDLLAATKTWLAAVEQNEPRALCAIGWRFENGLTLAPDTSVASYFYRRALDLGYQAAKYALSRVGSDACEPQEPVTPAITDNDFPQCIVETLSEAPRVFRLRHLMSQDECFHLISMATPYLHPSRIIESGSGKVTQSRGRRSGTARLTGPLRDAVVWNIEQRIARYAEMPAENSEMLTILHYEVGDEYRPHHDYFDPAIPGRETALKRGGQRVATLMTYLNGVEQGGATEFPDVGLRIDPEPGTGLLFFNVHKDGSLDPLTRHAGTPVLSGDKWIATRWIREREWTLAANAE